MILSDKIYDVLVSELEVLDPSLLVMTDKLVLVDCKAVADILTEAITDTLAEKFDGLYSAVIERELDILMYRARIKNGRRHLALFLLICVALVILYSVIFMISTG